MMDDGHFELTLGGTVYRFPEPSLKFTRRLLAVSKSLQSSTEPDALVDSMLGLVLDALRPAYPDLTLEALEDKAKFRDVAPVMQALANAAGLVQSGEAKPATT